MRNENFKILARINVAVCYCILELYYIRHLFFAKFLGIFKVISCCQNVDFKWIWGLLWKHVFNKKSQWTTLRLNSSAFASLNRLDQIVRNFARKMGVDLISVFTLWQGPKKSFRSLLKTDRSSILKIRHSAEKWFLSYFHIYHSYSY